MASTAGTKRRSTNNKSKGNRGNNGSARASSNNSRTSGTSRSNKRNSNYSNNNSISNIYNEILLVLIFIISILLFLCNFGIIGSAGNSISKIMFGIFGIVAYVFPILMFYLIAFKISNPNNPEVIIRIIAWGVLAIVIGGIGELFAANVVNMSEYSFFKIYVNSATKRNGGGIISGSLIYLLNSLLDIIGSVIVIIALGAISIMVISGRSIIKGIKSGTQHIANLKMNVDSSYYDEYEEYEEEDDNSDDVKTDEPVATSRNSGTRGDTPRLSREERKSIKEDNKMLRMDNKLHGITKDVMLTHQTEVRKIDINEDIHEITMDTSELLPVTEVAIDKEVGIVSDIIVPTYCVPKSFDMPMVSVNVNREAQVESIPFGGFNNKLPTPSKSIINAKVDSKSSVAKTRGSQSNSTKEEKMLDSIINMHTEYSVTDADDYVFPPIDLLNQSKQKVSGSNKLELEDTAIRLQKTLETFGVNVVITDINQGPTVTRYELQPQEGVKVSKIVNLSDDIKLNLAATDIRIEAPIPGKAAIGIEVPNKENVPVFFRDLIDSDNFRDFKSNLAFAVGKDIAGKNVVADIATMPHMLIAGATGSGKSVCINTLIMSILYKASPKDVKLIMIDPKVVELSVYNGIPHLMVPVVTEPKKASAALGWAVNEMTKRYKLFADNGARDIKGFNSLVTKGLLDEDGNSIDKLPHIVIIVDELADLMMVSASEVEEAICRLAQLARAAGIHIIIATQRPSVDVITGLIKANMPSRLAFAVSSGVDSRTILDMNGAEKLLGKGDMLFYPQNYSKPVRIQGAFVTDNEVIKVVDFLKNKENETTYDNDIIESINNVNENSNEDILRDSGIEDEYLIEAAHFIIEKDKASIGMLQRVFKIGFNRAARIMDRLAEIGVVGEEEGTKPRKILMSLSEFDCIIGTQNTNEV